MCEEDEEIRYLEIGGPSDFSVIIICNIHAREVISAEMCMDWAQNFAQNPQDVL